MSKHNKLTAEEFSKFSPCKRTLNYLEAYRKQKSLERKDMNILDWGCGRGRETLWLKDMGYNAYGVDVSSEPIKNGIELFKIKGYNSSTLSLLDSNGKTTFPNNFFHFTFSNQVFEHVNNIESVAKEIERVTMDSGVGFHIYPAHKGIIEGHLFMPFIHWLPKNILRRYLISLYVIFGVEPHWDSVKNAANKEKIHTYYQYSIYKTYYRNPSYIRNLFQKKGFEVNFETVNTPALTKYKILAKLIQNTFFKKSINYLLITFKSVELVIKKR